ncbi:protein argonaute-3-like [Bradysia coprophila]|uniref:protein argonaute-3-like n=1 Tax=Bradysia coprophila TaxID=38358 RepID=UPI00187DBF00|nr:protein argonaute-3-like [Bradysia coprophila]
MNSNRQTHRGFGRGELLRRLAANAAASSSSTSDETRSNISSATSTDSLLDDTTTTNNTSLSPADVGILNCSTTSTDFNDTGFNSTLTTNGNARPQGRGRLLQSMLLAQQSISNNSFNLESEPKPFGMGRGRLLKALAEANHQAEKKAEESVANVEDSIENLSLGSSEEEPVIRRGTSGRDVEIMTNFLELRFDSNKGVFYYEVRYTPDVHAKNLREKLLSQHKGVIGSTRTFDGVTLYLPIKLPNQITELTSESPTDGTTYQLRIIFKRKMRMSECTHLYNVLFDRIMKQLQYVRFGRKKFDPTAPKVIPQHKLEVWPGYVTAVDEYEDGIMLNLDVSHRLLCKSTVLEMMVNIHRSDKENFQGNAVTALLGSVVLTRYNNRTYRVDDVDFDASPKSTFKMNDRDISYIDYYMSHYGIHIMDENQPLLVHREERRVAGQKEKETITFFLVPEICYLTGITDTLRSDQKVMRDIATITRVTPEQRMHAYEKFCDNVNNSPEATAILQNWGLSLGGPRKIWGRQLENETVTFGNGKCIAERGDFNKFVANHSMLKVIDLKSWLILYTRRDEKATKSFVELMQLNATPMGMDVCRPRIECLQDEKTETYVRKLRSCINSSLQIIVLVCPSSRDDRYAAIKKVCCAELPIPTQVINGRTLSNEAKNRAIVQKIALQMNCKMGGALWAINIPLKNGMICGIDTYHDADKKKNSVSAFVASLNATFTQWFSRATVQSCKEELLNGLCQSLIAALTAYKNNNGEYPAKIIVYRDGVGDGQLAVVKEYELPQMRNACKLLDENYDPAFTFIVVQKRIHARLFAVHGGKLENPEPGCVIDHTITRRFLYDFFLVPQSVRQGTVTPTHYIVIEDTSDYPPDVLQRLSYKLCYLYYNWPGSVRVPACCQYAHKLAYLVGQSIKRQPAESLSDKLFFL